MVYDTNNSIPPQKGNQIAPSMEVGSSKHLARFMMLVDIDVQTRDHNYDAPKDIFEKELSVSETTLLHIHKPSYDTILCPPKGVLKKRHTIPIPK